MVLTIGGLVEEEQFAFDVFIFDDKHIMIVAVLDFELFEQFFTTQLSEGECFIVLQSIKACGFNQSHTDEVRRFV